MGQVVKEVDMLYPAALEHQVLQCPSTSGLAHDRPHVNAQHLRVVGAGGPLHMDLQNAEPVKVMPVLRVDAPGVFQYKFLQVDIPFEIHNPVVLDVRNAAQDVRKAQMCHGGGKLLHEIRATAINR